jgi:S-layer protein (TIGR01567 family)
MQESGFSVRKGVLDMMSFNSCDRGRALRIAFGTLVIVGLVLVSTSIAQTPSQSGGGSGGGGVINGSAASGPFTWTALNFPAFWHEDGVSSEILAVLQPDLTSDQRVIHEWNLSYSTTRQIIPYKVYTEAGLNVDNGLDAFGTKVPGGGGYYGKLGWLGKPYVALNGQANKLSPIVIEQNSNDSKDLSVNDTWNMGEGYNLILQGIDTNIPRQAYLVLSNNSGLIDDKVIQEGQVYTYYAGSFAGESNVPFFVTYVDNITVDSVRLKYTWLISDNVTIIDSGQRFGILTVISAGTFRNELSNLDYNITLSRNSIINLLDDLYLVVNDSPSLEYYPMMTFTPPVSNQPPVADFIYSPLNPVVNQTITFDASPSYDTDGNIASYWWNISGKIFTTNMVSISFPEPRTYYAGLIVTDNDGATNYTYKWINVTGGGATPTLITTISVPGRPSSIAITSDGARAFVADIDGTASVVRVIDVHNNTIVATIDDPRFFSLNTLAITPDDSQVYVLGVDDFVIDANTFAVNPLPTKRPFSFFGSLAIMPDGTKVYVGKPPQEGSVDATIFVLNPTNNSVMTTIALPGDPARAIADPSYMAIRSDNTRLYVTDRNFDFLYVVDTRNDTILTRISVGQRPEGVALTKDGLRAFVANVFSNNLSVVDTTNNSIVTSIPVGSNPGEVHITPDGCLAFVPNLNFFEPTNDTVSVIDVAANSVIRTFSTFSYANIPGVTEKGILAFTPDSRRVYLIEGAFPGAISVIDISELCPIAPIPAITRFAPPSPVSDVIGATRVFNITVNQTVNVTWLINDTQVQFNESVTETQYINTNVAQGTWNVTAVASNANGIAMQTWIWIVMSIPAAGSISGFKINDTNGNGKWNADEKGISNWTIRLIGITGKGKDSKVIRKDTFTNATGFYKFDNLPAGRYFVIEKLKKGFVPTSSPVKRIKLAQGENSMNNNFTNRPVRSLDRINGQRDIDDYEVINREIDKYKEDMEWN